MEGRLEKNERDLPAILEGFWEDKTKGGFPPAGASAPAGPALGREERYWKCRRSLWVWPLEAGTEDKLEIFLLSKLG